MTKQGDTGRLHKASSDLANIREAGDRQLKAAAEKLNWHCRRSELAAGERDTQTAHSGCVKSAGVKRPACSWLSWSFGAGLILWLSLEAGRS